VATFVFQIDHVAIDRLLMAAMLFSVDAVSFLG